MMATPGGVSTKALQPLAWGVTLITFCVGLNIGIWQGSWSAHGPTIHIVMQPVFGLWVHNASIVVLAFLGILSFGMVTWFVVFWNGINFGYIAMMTIHYYGVLIMLGGILPHGIFEIPADLMAFQADIMCVGTVARYVLHRPVTPSEGPNSMMPVLRLAAKRNLVALGLLGIAAIIESFVTPMILQGLLH